MILALLLVAGQELGSLDQVPVKARQYVAYAAEQQVVPAGKRGTLELRFRVFDGFHVNSHMPKSELLIPTKVEFEAGAGVKTLVPEYPAGKELTFSFDPTEKLDVYSDDFVVKVPVVARPGAHELKGTLTYQACNRAACYPVKTLPVEVLFEGK